MSRNYDFRSIESHWQNYWENSGTFTTHNQSDKPKYYVLDMFPYPSGAGLHVGHPLGYIASDIIARYKRLQGYNVLHPMGFDAFGLPAEQYAIEHGIHPAVSTEANIGTFKKQLKNIGFSYDWSREIRTSDPAYYKWTQWIFMQLYQSYYDIVENKAKPISLLIQKLEQHGNDEISAETWKQMSRKERETYLMKFRLAFISQAEVWWCAALGTVLANDEVVNGVSERGGHPVEKRKMNQWFLRITSYADRLLEGLEQVEFSEAMKEMQRNWIGRSEGCEVDFAIEGQEESLKVFTTRPDTLFGVDFMVLAPEHEKLLQFCSAEQLHDVTSYVQYTKSRSELERQSEIQNITGVFTGAFAIHPLSGRKIPVWTSEYVLGGYGTGAIMAVPCGDERDFNFARHFQIPITNILGDAFNEKEANSSKSVIIRDSDFISDLPYEEAKIRMIEKLEQLNLGKRKVNYRMRDAGFSRQRYWGEPFPVLFDEDGVPELMDARDLPLLLPELNPILPGPDGQGPLANVSAFVHPETGKRRETSTMPGYAGSSWYFLRFMDPHNETEFCAKNIADYWKQVDLYVGGSEHAVGHLLYSRMWTKVLCDLGHISFDEPFARLINQGKIGGDSRLAYRIHGTNTFVSAGLKDGYETDELHVDIKLVNGLELDCEGFKKWKPDLADAEFIFENGVYICGSRLEKMGKRYFNVVNPDDVVAEYGADTLRLYEMFLGPLEDNKPWNIQGIDGVHRFLKKVWKLFYNAEGELLVHDLDADPGHLRILHQTIRKIGGDLDKYAFNTCVSAFMICVNELSGGNGCHNREVLKSLVVMLAPFAPHIAEELYKALGNNGSVFDAPWPEFDATYLEESVKVYPVSVNGKVRAQITVSADAGVKEVEELALAQEAVQKWLEGQSPKKVIVVPGRIVNIVV